MLRLALSILVLLSACATPGPRPASEEDARAVVLRQEEAWHSALVARDAEALEALLAPEFVLSGSAPVPETRAQYLATTRMPERTLEPLVVSDREVRVYGDTAVSLGVARLRGAWRGNPLDLRFRYTNVWVQRAAGWQAVTGHITLLRD